LLKVELKGSKRSSRNLKKKLKKARIKDLKKSNKLLKEKLV
jgi:hypothetical protein